MENLSNLLSKGLKPLNLEEVEYDPDKIIEVNSAYRSIHRLPPERITRRKYERRMEIQRKRGIKALREFLKTKFYLEKYEFPKINIKFGCNIIYN